MTPAVGVAFRWQGVAGILGSTALLALFARGGYAFALGFVVLVPWLWGLDRVRTYSGVVASSLLMSVGFTLAVFAWFGPAVGAYIGIGALSGWALLVVLAPVFQLQILVFALVRHQVGRSHGPVLRAVASAAAWVGCEWLVPKLLGDTLGHGLYPSESLRQVADLGGAAGLSFLLILANEAVAIAVAARRQRAQAMWRPLVAMLAIVVLMTGYGHARLLQLEQALAEPAPALRVGLVQSGIVNYEQLREQHGAYAVVRRVLDTHFAMSQAAIEQHGADVLLWSETVYPTTFGHPRSEDGAELDREVLGFVNAVGVPLVFGTYDLDAEGEYNAAAFVAPGRGLLGYYRKAHPFPLTEYVPPWLDGPLLRRLLPWAGNWQPGAGARVFPLRSAQGLEVNVVPLICLDDVRPQLAIEGARLGAQAILGMSNDSWFSEYPLGAELHLAVAAFRSVETRLPQLRVTSNGISALIDEAGNVLVSTAMGDQAVLAGQIPARDPQPTLMVLWGDWVGAVALLFLLLLGAGSLWRALRRRARSAAAVAEAESTDAPYAPYAADAIILSPPWRMALVALRLCVALGLLWLLLGMLRGDGLQIQSLSQIWLFAAAVAAPALAAWALQRACAGRVRIEDRALLIEQAAQRAEIPLRESVLARVWRIPFPAAAVELRLGSGRVWNQAVVVADSGALLRALAVAGSGSQAASPWRERLAGYAVARAQAARPWLDHPLIKFVLFPLLPALPAFRLHQHIAFGGSFGEYYSYGAGAYAAGLLIWWASWVIGLVLFAAVLRVLVESLLLLSLPLKHSHAGAARDLFEWGLRLVYYFGVPAWLLLRVFSG